MKTWITSDLHFGHRNIKNFCPATRARFPDVDSMNEMMVTEWNALVAPEDTVYILGDVAFLPAQQAAEYVNRLNGFKHLIEGNHDRKLLKDPVFRGCFQTVQSYLRLNYNGKLIVMSHYPFLEWDQMHRGSLHFFGHLHGKPTGQEQYRNMDVGMDATGQIVIQMEDAISAIINKKIKEHHV